MTFTLLLLWIGTLYIRPQETLMEVRGFPLMELVAGATIIAWGLSIVTRKVRPSFSYHGAFLTFFLIAIMASWLSQGSFESALNAFLEFGKVVLLFFIIASEVDSPKKVKALMALMVLLTLTLSIQGIYQFHTGVGFGGETLIEGRIRGTGMFNDPNDLALAMVAAIPFSLSIISSRHWPGMARFLALASVPFIFYAIYLTGSRGGIIGLGVALILFFGLRVGWAKGAMVAALVAVLFITWASPWVRQIDLTEASARGRIEAWSEGLQMVKSSPLFGVGWRNSPEYHGLTAHNSFLLAGSDTGLVGLFLWVALIWVSFKTLYLCTKPSPLEGKKAIFIRSSARDTGASLGGFLTSAAFLSQTYSYLLYILLALSPVLLKIANREGLVPPLRLSLLDLGVVVLLGFMGLALIYMFILIFW